MTTTSEASHYQQLRDHLHYLRLPDAATALPPSWTRQRPTTCPPPRRWNGSSASKWPLPRAAG